MKKINRIMSVLLAITLVIGMTFATGCSQKKDPSEKVVVTVGDKNLYLDEAMFYIYYYEQSYLQYQQYYNTSIWDIKGDDGKTVSVSTKENIMNTLIQTEILYDKATKDKLTLTDTEKSDNATYADQYMKNMTDDQKKITGLTKENITNILNKNTLATKYKQKLVDSYDIDDEAIKKTIKYEDHRQYNTEYLYVPTASYDANNNLVQATDEEKATAKKSLETAMKKVEAGEAFADIVKDDTTIKTSTLNFVYGDTNAETAYQDAAIKLENDEYTKDIVETDSGYFIIKMVDNKSTESYDQAVDDAITTAENDAFDKDYTTIKKDYTTTINKKVWDDIVLGKTTLSETNSNTTAGTNTNTTDSNTTGSNTTDSNTTGSTTESTAE